MKVGSVHPHVAVRPLSTNHWEPSPRYGPLSKMSLFGVDASCPLLPSLTVGHHLLVLAVLLSPLSVSLGSGSIPLPWSILFAQAT